MKLITLFILSILLLTSCAGPAASSPQPDQDAATVSTVLPVTGTFLNLVYQDVRNKYTNPPYMDYADPALWTAKVQEMHQMGMEYLVLMAVASMPSWRLLRQTG